ncbi:MAG: tetratricopeptide repeat protein [Cyclobacteriaceae bacterium]
MEDEELIRKYIRNECSKEESDQVESWLSSDPSFKQLLDQERIVTLGVGLAERERLKRSLKEEKSSKRIYWYAAAAIIPLLILGYLNNIATSDYSGLFSQNYETYGVYEFGNERGSEDSLTRENEAFVHYKNGDFQQALDLLEKLNNQNPGDGYQFYQSICLVELNRDEEALEGLRQIRNEESDYYTLSQWYSGLILIKMERIEEARKSLLIVKEAGGGPGKKAAQLLEEL